MKAINTDTSDLAFLVRHWGRTKQITGPDGQGTLSGQFKKLLEEVGELGEALMEDDTTEIIDAIGDCAVVLILLADMKGLRFEECLRDAYDVIKTRKGRMEGGVFVKKGEHEDCHSSSHCGCL